MNNVKKLFLFCIAFLTLQCAANAAYSDKLPVVAYGYNYSMINEDHELLVWGDYGATAIEDATTNVQDVASIVPGGIRCRMVIDQDRTLYALNSTPQQGEYICEKVFDRAASAYCGLNHYLVIDGENTLYVGGRNDAGQLGIGETDMLMHEPTALLTDVAAVSTDCFNGSYAVLLDGTLLAWGTHDQQLIATQPIVIAKNIQNVFQGQFVLTCDHVLCELRYGENVISLEPIADHVIYAQGNLLIKEDHSLWVWGTNSPIAIIDGTAGDLEAVYLDGNAPTKLLEHVSYASVGAFYTFVTFENGELWQYPTAALLRAENGMETTLRRLRTGLPNTILNDEPSGPNENKEDDSYNTESANYAQSEMMQRIFLPFVLLLIGIVVYSTVRYWKCRLTK